LSLPASGPLFPDPRRLSEPCIGRGSPTNSPQATPITSLANDAQYTAQKGFCEDLDEGKFSLPLIHALAHTDKTLQLRGLLRERHRKGKCSVEQKRFILGLMREAGSLTYVLHVLKSLHTELEHEVERLESIFGKANQEIRSMLTLLKM
jgi:geranylgeranyl pyrophosphate synthase